MRGLQISNSIFVKEAKPMQHQKPKARLRRPHRRQRPEWEKETDRVLYRMEILEEQELDPNLKAQGWIPLTEQELMKLSDADLVDTLRQIRTLQGWEGASLLEGY